MEEMMSNLIVNDFSNEMRVLDASEIDDVAGGFFFDRIGSFLKDVLRNIAEGGDKTVTVKCSSACEVTVKM